jgi:hypothetical protein
MTVNTRVSDNEDVSLIPADKDSYRQLIQQFYESSIQRYGVDSEQTEMFKVHLTAHSTYD